MWIENVCLQGNAEQKLADLYTYIITIILVCSGYNLTRGILFSCSLAELPECRLEIASNSDVLRQLIAVITTRTYKYIASLVSVAGMLCLAYRYATCTCIATVSIS